MVGVELSGSFISMFGSHLPMPTRRTKWNLQIDDEASAKIGVKMGVFLFWLLEVRVC